MMGEDVNIAHEELEDAIRKYFRALWLEQGVDVENTIIVHWAVPVFFREVDKPGLNWGYGMETALGMATHEMRGLLYEADSWITEQLEKEE